jgi:nucleotide-binding universal stress UspA family protein
VKAIEGALRSLPGVASWQVNLLERTLRVQFDPAALQAEAILAAIRGLGMTPELTERAMQAVAWRRDPLFLSTVTSGVCLGAALIMDWAGITSAVGHALHGMALRADGWVARTHGPDAVSPEITNDTAYLERVRAEFQAVEIPAESELAHGEPAKEIVKWVQEKACDLVAMSTHGPRAVADLFLGETASQVQHRVSVPVLLLRAK